MCGRKWWQREGGDWHKPVAAAIRSWEVSAPTFSSSASVSAISAVSATNDASMGTSRNVDETQDDIMFKHNASPFRRSEEPPPKFSWTHVWGTVKWGKKAGAWGQGVEGLKDRKK
jgi:protein AFG1